MRVGPPLPMCRLNVGVLLTRTIDPIGALLVTGIWKCMDDAVEVQCTDFEISVRRSYRGGLPSGHSCLHDQPPLRVLETSHPPQVHLASRRIVSHKAELASYFPSIEQTNRFECELARTALPRWPCTCFPFSRLDRRSSCVLREGPSCAARPDDHSPRPICAAAIDALQAAPQSGSIRVHTTEENKVSKKTVRLTSLEAL